jgi:hypothetical protein
MYYATDAVDDMPYAMAGAVTAAADQATTRLTVSG